jgi:enoyl-CoA hydratase
VTYETILLERLEGGVARITLNRPARVNALNVRTLKELNLALDEIERDAGIHVVILTGAGGSFSSGFDLKEQAESGPSGPEEWGEALRYDFDTVTRFWHFPKPTLAAVPGACLAGGLELALCCDITIASENAFFGEPELKFGAGIVVMVLPWIVGPKVAKDIILTGEDRITAQRAHEIGLITRIVPADELQEAALRIARRVAVIAASTSRGAIFMPPRDMISFARPMRAIPPSHCRARSPVRNQPSSKTTAPALWFRPKVRRVAPHRLPKSAPHVPKCHLPTRKFSPRRQFETTLMRGRP